jgi:beta-glucosidase
VTASVDVTNSGSRAGDEIVQLYVGFPGSKLDRPVKLLRGFERVSLVPGQTRRISLPVKARDLSYYDVGSKAWTVERLEYPVLVGGSSRSSDLLTARFRVVD